MARENQTELRRGHQPANAGRGDFNGPWAGKCESPCKLARASLLREMRSTVGEEMIASGIV